MPRIAINEPRNARSRRTRAALLDAARSIFEDHGIEELTMTAVAGRAGVTRRAAYMHFATRSQLVTALFDHIAEAEGLHQSVQKVWQASNAAAALDEWAAHLARHHPTLLALDRALQRAWQHDTDAAAHRDRVISTQLGNCHNLARLLANASRLREPWTVASAADMLYALTSSDIIEALRTDRRWSRQRLVRGLRLLFRSTFVADHTHT
jgi:AcrR family transcriptional regulator